MDAFAGTQLDAIGDAFTGWKNIAQRIQELEHGEQDRLRLLDLWSFQSKEIADAKLHPGDKLGIVSEPENEKNPQAIVVMGAPEVPVGRLTPGMVFMDDLYTQIGTLLVPKGFEVTETFLERARNFGPGILQEKVRVLALA